MEDMPQNWSMLLVTHELIQDLLSPLKRPLGFGLTHCHQKPVGEVDGERWRPLAAMYVPGVWWVALCHGPLSLPGLGFKQR